MEPKKKVYEPGEGSECETPPPADETGENPIPGEVPVEEGSGDYVEEKDDADEDDDTVADYRKDSRSDG